MGASGGSIVDAAFTKADRSSIQASGGSEIRVRGVDAPQLSGGSQLHGRDFSARDAEVQGSGGSQAELKVSGNLKGGLSGGSQLHVAGGASARVATSGGSGVFND